MMGPHRWDLPMGPHLWEGLPVILWQGFAAIKDDTSLVSRAGGLLSAAGAAAALERREKIVP